MTIAITAILTLLVSMPVILWLDRNSWNCENTEETIESWHNFTNTMKRGE